MKPTVAPYGSWASPLTAKSYADRSVFLTQLRVDGTDVYWVEESPKLEGRKVLLRRSALGRTGEILPLLEGTRLPDVETHVHGLGGRAYTVKEGVVVFSDGTDDRVYSFDTTGARQQVKPLTYMDGYRYGDFVIDETRDLVYAVREEQAGELTRSTLVAIPLDGSGARDGDKIITIFSGDDFVASPRLSPDRHKIAWLTWNRPELPWTKTELQVGSLTESGELATQVTLVDMPDVMVSEPRWTLEGDLVHIDDSTGWANLYRTEGFELQGSEPEDAWASRLRTRALHPGARNFSHPKWQLGLHSYANLDSEHIVCSWSEGPEWHIGTVQLSNGLLEEWDTGWWPTGNIAAGEGRVYFVGDAADRYSAILKVSNSRVRVLRESTDVTIDSAFNSPAKFVSWTSRDGAALEGLYYAPKNPGFVGPEGDLPPLITMVHSGPAETALPGLSLRHQYWTTRGFAVLDVNFRGSSGLGREYREALDGQFGILDVHDVVDGVRWVLDRQLADPERVAISGSLSGGFTALRALAETDIFSAGTSQGGYLDLREVALTAPPVVGGYLRRLVGTGDMEDKVWDERSPLNQVEDIDAPVLLLHGTNNDLVPLAQVVQFFDKLVLAGNPVALVSFQNEGRTLQRSDSLEQAWRTELAFYAELWDIELQHPVPVPLVNRKV